MLADVTYKAAICNLLKAGFDIFTPLQRPLFDELVISYRNQLQRCIVRKVTMHAKSGPYLANRIKLGNEKILLNDLSVDLILAVWPERDYIWLIPIHCLLDQTTLSLGNRSEWLVEPITNQPLGPVTKEQRIIDRIVTGEAKDELNSYVDIIKG